ncbi:MAG: tRNA pseudouridine(55) synthase TruB [Chloroflexi bacterium]|nr:tRNA pseudouridine(55) synthase TruB [Chloroflexota bacterium]
MANSQKPQIDGILNIHKPYGMTSMDVVRRVKRAVRQRRVGHGGTLDPIATGVLPVFLGQATRLMEHVVGGGKTYLTSIELGITTDTYDALGEITARTDASTVSAISHEYIERVLPDFSGEILQVPPMYSALKRDGKRLYELARAGVEVEREARPVVVHNVALTEWTPPVATLEIHCGKGFYVRSLAHDIGQALGCGGNMKSLVRLKSGAFAIENAVSIEEMEDRFADGSWHNIVHSPDAALRDMRALVVGKQLEDMIRNGRAFNAGAANTLARPEERCRVYTTDGRFLAIVAYDAPTQQWRPEKVFALNYAEQESAVVV